MAEILTVLYIWGYGCLKKKKITFVLDELLELNREFEPDDKLADDQGDPCKNIGIKMVSKIAQEMNYQSTFGSNVLTIRL